jgi:hypothetical protein
LREREHRVGEEKQQLWRGVCEIARVDRAERRRHVRARPLAELPVAAVRLGANNIHETLTVADVSVGGLALMSAVGKVGDRWEMQIGLGRFGDHRVDVVVRWVGAGLTGVELVDLAPEAAQAMSKYVGELLERGA